MDCDLNDDPKYGSILEDHWNIFDRFFRWDLRLIPRSLQQVSRPPRITLKPKEKPMSIRDRKIYHLLALLPPEEYPLFDEFLLSPLFEPSKTLQKFFALWRERVLSADIPSGEDLSPVDLLEGSKLIPSRMDKYCSGLYKKVLEFMAFRHFQQRGHEQLEFASRELESRSAPRKEWEAQRSKVRKSIDQMGSTSETMYLELRYRWKEAQTRVHTRETHAIWKEDFQSLHEAIDRYYHLEKLKLACAGANARLIFNRPTGEEPDEPDFLTRLTPEEAPLVLSPLAYCYWLTLRLYLAEDGTEEFDLLFEQLQTSNDGFDWRESRELFNYALNYCIRRGNKGEVAYQERVAALYRELLANGNILSEGKLEPQAMKNIVMVHCDVGELDWAEQFIHEYQDRLLGEPNQNVIKYNRAVVAYFRLDPIAIKLFKEVISLLKGDVFYELDSRTYLLKAYFEHFHQLSMEELDDMYRMLDSFRVYIDRNKVISQIHRSRYRNFISEFRRFLKLLEQEPGSVPVEQFLKLHRKVQETEHISNKRWFLDRLSPYLERPSA